MGRKEGLSGSSFFTWFMVIALLGVWTSVAVVWFELVDYEDVLAKAKDFHYNLSEVLQGKLEAYDTDGDGDFDIEDAKVLLGLKDREVAKRESKDSETDSGTTSESISDQDLEDIGNDDLESDLLDGGISDQDLEDVGNDDLESDLLDEDISDLEEALDDHEAHQAEDDEVSEFNLEDAVEPSVHKSLNAEPANDEPEEAELVTEEQADIKEEIETEEQVFVKERVEAVDQEPPASEDDDDDDDDDDVEDLPLTHEGEAEEQEPEEERQEADEEPVVEDPELEADTPDLEADEEPVYEEDEVEEVAAEPLAAEIAEEIPEPVDEEIPENEELEVAGETEAEPQDEYEDHQDEAEVPEYQQQEEVEVVEEPVIEEQAEEDVVPFEALELTPEEIDELLTKTQDEKLYEEHQVKESPEESDRPSNHAAEQNTVTSEEPHEDHAGKQFISLN
ncbi:unnamed protein product [Staurois parvus]|uniref:Aspartyl beta-hydroxylase/Triadin domain-containing protein n=1 Tax=Staurois parvus TaxID=386267 RepID=A0ABN9CGC4_9NEOB|nr:unnamed protein product [Staurois parvus]